MDILTEQDKELLRSQRSGLDMLRCHISILSAEYSLKGIQLLQRDRNDVKGLKMMGISHNLDFGCESIDMVNQIGKELRTELNRAKDKIYSQMVKIDEQDAEIKRLKKLNDELKKNISLGDI